jgi:hypothetical protein
VLARPKLQDVFQQFEAIICFQKAISHLAQVSFFTARVYINVHCLFGSKINPAILRCSTETRGERPRR